MLPPIIHLKRVALDLFFPRWCISCGKEGNYICGSCRENLPVITPPVCPGCGRPQPRASICNNCNAASSELDGVRSPFVFDGVIRQAILELKYRNLRALVPLLASLLHDYLKEYPIPGDVLVPVPLHPKRRRERGYNQSALIAKELGKLNDLPIVTDCLVRRSHALPQTRSAGIDERYKNVSNAFTCLDSRLRDNQVILIDDVSTSGATLDACARVCKSAGATSAWGLTMALEL